MSPSFIGDQSNSRVLPNMLGGLKKATQQSSVNTYYDAMHSNQLRVVIGAIASALGATYATPEGSDYGLAVVDPMGNVHEVNPASCSGTTNGPLSTPSTSYVDLGCPEVTFYVGSSGSALVFISAQCTTTVTNQSALCGISFDGSTVSSPNLAVGSGDAVISVSASATILQASLGTGQQHTAKPMFASSNSSTVSFSEISLVVWPI